VGVKSNSDQIEHRDPPDVTSLMRDGDEHLRQGRGTQAEACFRAILEHQPDNPDALHRCGMIAFLRGAPREAAGLLRRATSIRSDDATLYGHLASALMACGELDEAIAYWLRALESAPDYAAAYTKLGNAYLAKGETEASEIAYRKSIEIAPDDPRALVGLGRILHLSNRNQEAEDALHRALEVGGGTPEVCMLVGTVLLEAGGLDAALELFEVATRAEPDEPRGHYRRALNIDPRHPLALKHLGVLLQERDQLDAAAECFERLLEANPDDDVARHMLAATTGATTKSPPAGYVTRLYDDYADRFDAHLGAIDYHVPELIRDAVLEVAGNGEPAWQILDLGCGTGQCGEVMRPLASFLAGVDLSPRMIAKAREREIYDSLTVGSIDDALEEQERSFDVIIAGDVFTYVGDLSGVFSGCARVLPKTGLAAFSIENTDEDGFRLCPTGRYAHSMAYVDATARASGLSVVYKRDTVLRKDPEPIPGHIVLLAKAT
jgi:predicted TPR repeat methyltransferase